MTDATATVDFVADKLDRVIEGYLCGLAEGSPDRELLIAANPDLAKELQDFVQQDGWMRGLAGSQRVDDKAGQRTRSSVRGETLPGETSLLAGAGSTFGEYDLLAEVGRGGMGVVYKARQKSLNRIVALKMIRSAQLASEQEVQRFYTEAESAAHLDHPGIVPVYAAGEHEGRHFYSMGYVEGVSLQELIADQSVLPAREAAELVRRVAEAIQYAHRRGVIHRDLKPANIMLAESGRAEGMQLPGRPGQRFEPKVTDFGLAKKTDADSELTGTGQVLGSPSYMPPEQVAGNSGPLSDVYSLGAVLYALLVGRPPFRAANPVQTLQQVVHDEPVPPRRVNSAVPRDLETICLKCLQKSPARRYASAKDLADDLKRFLDGAPIMARPVGALERAYKSIRRHPATAALAVVGLIMLMACVGLLVSWSYQGELKRALYRRNVLVAHEAWRGNDIIRAQELLQKCEPHLRGWEWDYVNRLSQTGLVTTIVAPGAGRGRLAPPGERRRLVCVWDAATGRELVVLKDLPMPVIGVQFGERADELWTANEDGTLRLWNLDTQQVMRTIQQTGSKLLLPRIAYSHDGRRIATGYLHPTWPDPIDRRTLSDRFASLQVNGTVQILHAEKLRDAVLAAYSERVNEVAVSPDRLRFASAGNDGAIKLWDIASCRLILNFEGHTGPVHAVRFSPDGKHLVSVGNDLTVRIWDALTGQVMLTFRGGSQSAGHTRAVVGVAFDPDGKQVVTVGADLAIKLWNVGSGTESMTFTCHPAPVRAIAFHPSGELLASAGEDGGVKLWDPKRGVLVRELAAPGKPVLSLAFSPDGKLLAAGGEDRTVRLWDVAAATATPSHILRGRQGTIYGVAFGQGGSLLASAGHDEKCILWNVSAGQIQQREKVPRPAGPLQCVACDLSGRFVALGGNDLALHDLTRQAAKLVSNDPKLVFTSVAFSPDGSRLVSGSPDGSVRIWHTGRKTQLAALTGHLAPVAGVVYSPAGDRIASASWDGSVKVWDPESREETLSLKSTGGRAHAVAFSPDGRWLASANHDGTVTLWGRQQQFPVETMEHSTSE